MIVDSEGKGDIKNELEVKDEKKALSIDCMISVSSNQASIAASRDALHVDRDLNSNEYIVM
jgi:hypothetical protein